MFKMLPLMSNSKRKLLYVYPAVLGVWKIKQQIGNKSKQVLISD